MSCEVCPAVENIFDLGCYSNCGTITLPIKANNSGVHTFHFTYNGVSNVFQEYERKGQRMKVPNRFKEGVVGQILKIVDPDGTPYVYHHYNKVRATCADYDTFTICTKITNYIIEPCDSVCCTPDLPICANDPVQC